LITGHRRQWSGHYEHLRALSPSMTVRTTTRFRPGRHDAVATRLCLLINQSFD
jgi:hypothetical protein